MDFRVRDFLYLFQIMTLRKELKKTKNFSHADLVEYQDRRLRELIRYAYDFIPYYKELFDKNKINPDKIKSVKDLPNIPVLTKKIVRERFDSLVCDKKFFKKYFSRIYHTSGSTGTPLKIYHDRYTDISKLIFYWSMWENAGYKIGERFAVASSQLADVDKIFNYEKLVNTLYFSLFKINQDNSLILLDELIRLKCKILRGYPTTIYNFLKFVESNKKIKKLSIKSVICVSESLLDFQRRYIESVLKVKVFNMYCQWEHVCLAMECEYGNMHHQMENGILEILDDKNNAVEDGKLGEITATGFYNRTMPLIRYKMGDLAIKSKINCACNRAHDVMERIDGRIEDSVVTSDNRLVTGLSNAFKYSNGFNFAQIVQNNKGSIDVRIVKNNNFSEKEMEILNKNLRSILGEEIKINFVFVSNIESSKNGKIRLVINNLIKNQ
jgi:phenylacetate-CoA ligase